MWFAADLQLAYRKNFSVKGPAADFQTGMLFSNKTDFLWMSVPFIYQAIRLASERKEKRLTYQPILAVNDSRLG